MLLPLHGKKNVLLYGLPGSGKTTLIECLVREIPCPKKGFYTKEVRERGRRVGFKINTLDGQEAWLARRGKGFPQVGKYRVYLDSFERLALPNIKEGSPGVLLVIDEIGKMELFSKDFQEAVSAALDSEIPVLATVGYGKLPYIEKLFRRQDAIYAEVTPESRNHLVSRIKAEFHRPGLLIVLEGLDGSGKTTLGMGLAKALKAKGLKVFLTYEPTNGEWGRKVREHLGSGSKISAQALAELFLRDRRDHVAREILPMLDKGWVVICDRYYLSTMAYQGACGLEIEDIRRRQETWAPIPDVVVYLDLPAEEGLKRIKNNVVYRPEIFEKADFLNQVSQIYQDILRHFRHEKIDARPDRETVLEECLDKLLYHIDEWKKRD